MTITGVSLADAVSVTFGGVAATFTVNSPTQITATVPAGAKTGAIAVVIPDVCGVAVSAGAFSVN